MIGSQVIRFRPTNGFGELVRWFLGDRLGDLTGSPYAYLPININPHFL